MMPFYSAATPSSLAMYKIVASVPPPGTVGATAGADGGIFFYS
jgi:hypothetical protein